MSAAGVMPGMRAACPKVAGESRSSLLACFGRKSTHAAIIEIGRQMQLLVPAKGQDIGLLALEIAGIAPVDLQLLGDLRRECSQLGPDAASSGKPMPG